MTTIAMTNPEKKQQKVGMSYQEDQEARDDYDFKQDIKIDRRTREERQYDNFVDPLGFYQNKNFDLD